MRRIKNRDRINKRKRYVHQRDKEKIKAQRSFLLDSKVKITAKAYKSISLYEDARPDPEDGDIGQVKCTYCDKWFNPTLRKCRLRERAIKGDSGTRGECRLYCSNNCKQACPTFGQITWPKGFKKATSREVNTILRKIVLERDNWQCQKCSKTQKEIQLHVHHEKSFTQNRILSDDPDNCIALCKACHKEIHQRGGCKYNELRCVS